MEYETFGSGEQKPFTPPPSTYDSGAQQQGYNRPQNNGGSNGGYSGGGYNGGGGNGNYGSQNQDQRNNGGGYGGGNGGGFRGNGGGGGRGGFQRKPEEITDRLYKPYAVMSNDGCPEHIIRQFQQIAERLGGKGFILRTNCTKGAAIAVEAVPCEKELILPWDKFENKETKKGWTTGTALATTARFHHAWDGLSDAVKKIIASGARLVAGDKMREPALFFICWSQDGAEHINQKSQGTGNVAVPLGIASELHIPVFNLGKEGSFERLMRHIGE